MNEHTLLDPATSEIARKQLGHVWPSTAQRYLEWPPAFESDRTEDTDG